MKLELSVSKKLVSMVSGPVEEVFFAVVDLDKAKNYPLNFVCMLPRNIGTKRGVPNKFLEIFGERSSQLATKLLTDALKREGDLDVKVEIKKRLKSLQPKPTIKCPICGCDFTPRRKGNLLQRFCDPCRNKNNSNS